MKSNHGFTMIELLMVMIIIANLGTVAAGQFIDFRNEFRAAAVRQTLATMRVGVKNQIQQARLRCGAEGNFNTTSRFGSSTFNSVFASAMSINDITRVPGTSGYQICTTAQVPNAAERKFWDDIPEPQRVPEYFMGTSSSTTYNFSKNPFARLASPSSVMLITAWTSVSQATINAAGGRCALVDAWSVNSVIHWFYMSETNEFFAGTNTPGINECNF